MQIGDAMPTDDARDEPQGRPSGAARSRAPPRMPRLLPVTMEPHRQSGTAIPIAVLSQIERIQVKYTVEQDRTTYFIMDVHLRHLDSRLPMTSSLRSRLRMRNDEITRPPDYQIGARFSDFAALRENVSKHMCMNARFTCEYCNTFDEYIKFRVTQPRWIIKIGTRVELRKSILESFINDFLNMTLQRVQTDSKCEARKQVPFLMERFLRRRYPNENNGHHNPPASGA